MCANVRRQVASSKSGGALNGFVRSQSALPAVELRDVVLVAAVEVLADAAQASALRRAGAPKALDHAGFRPDTGP